MTDSFSNMVDRKEDMSPDGYLRLVIEDDGDIIVVCAQDSGMLRPQSATVQFCTGPGGGGSPHTLRALRQLYRAMALDNQDDPDANRRKEFSGDASLIKEHQLSLLEVSERSTMLSVITQCLGFAEGTLIGLSQVEGLATNTIAAAREKLNTAQELLRDKLPALMGITNEETDSR